MASCPEPSTNLEFVMLQQQVPQSSSVARWKNMSEAYCCMNGPSFDCVRRRLGIQRVLEIRRFRAKQKPHHREYLVALLDAREQPDWQQSTRKYILIERDVDWEGLHERDPEGQVTTLKWRLPVRSKTRYHDPKEMTSEKTNTNDIVRELRGWPTNDVEQLSQVKYPATGPGPILLDLVLAQ
ncbi:hypothetical protein H0H81_001047, partial [Sphagnurus paluster]